MQSEAPLVVYVDPLEVGHRTEHLAFHLRVCWEAGLRLSAFVPSELWAAASKLAGAAAAAGEHGLDLRLHTKSLSERRALLKQIGAAASAKSASLIYFCMYDTFLFAHAILTLQGGRLGVPWTGLFFADCFNYLRDELDWPKRFVKSFLKLLSLQIALRSGATALLTLNEQWHTAMPVPVIWLPDALSSLDQMAADASRTLGWPVPRPADGKFGRKRFLMFGAMQPRKGIAEMAQAFLRLSDAELSRVEMRVLGKFDRDGNYRARVDVLLQEMVRRGAFVECVDSYVSEADLDKALRICDYVLAPYLRHVGSSGVMGLAAQYGRPLLTQKTYQIGADVRRFALGVSAEARDPIALCQGLRAMLAGEVKITPGIRQFRDTRSPERAFTVMKETMLRLSTKEVKCRS